MVKWLRRFLAILSLAIAIAVAVFWIKGYRNSTCAYWTRDPNQSSSGEYWQLDTVDGRLQLLHLDPYPHPLSLTVKQSDRGAGRTSGPLIGAVILARFGKGPVDVPGLVVESGRATTFEVAFSGTVVTITSAPPTTRPAQAGNATAQVIADMISNPNPNYKMIPPATQTAAGGRTGAGTPITFSSAGSGGGRLSVQTGSIITSGTLTISGSSAATGTGSTAQIRVSGNAFNVTMAGPGATPYVFISVNGALLCALLLLLPIMIEVIPVVRRRRRRAARLRAGQCLECGYDLSGAAHERCPECGRPCPAR